MASSGTVDVYSSESSNNGIVGQTDLEADYLVSENNPFYIVFGDHTRSMNLASRNFSVMDNVRVLSPKFKTMKDALFICSAWKKTIPNLGYSRHWSVAKNSIFQLPVTTNGEIDFDFMESFILELEKERIHKLEAYLKTSGLFDYNLTEEEKEALKLFDSTLWGEFRIGDLFEIKNTLSFNADRLTEGTEYDYITRTSFNQGILKSTGFVNRENVNNAGTWSLGLLQMDFFYRRKPWYAGQFVRKVVPKFEVNENVVPFFSTLLNRLKPVLLPVLVRNVDTTFLNTNILLPVTTNGEIDFDFMELFIRAVQKTVIKDVALFTDEKIKATKRIVNTL